MTTKAEISGWFDDGVFRRQQYMLVVCDTFDHDDYPVYAASADECMARYKSPGDMQRVMEVYNLTADKDEQLNKPRVMNLPPLPKAPE